MRQCCDHGNTILAASNATRRTLLELERRRLFLRLLDGLLLLSLQQDLIARRHSVAARRRRAGTKVCGSAGSRQTATLLATMTQQERHDVDGSNDAMKRRERRLIQQGREWMQSIKSCVMVGRSSSCLVVMAFPKLPPRPAGADGQACRNECSIYSHVY